MVFLYRAMRRRPLKNGTLFMLCYFSRVASSSRLSLLRDNAVHRMSTTCTFVRQQRGNGHNSDLIYKACILYV